MTEEDHAVVGDPGEASTASTKALPFNEYCTLRTPLLSVADPVMFKFAPELTLTDAAFSGAVIVAVGATLSPAKVPASESTISTVAFVMPFGVTAGPLIVTVKVSFGSLAPGVTKVICTFPELTPGPSVTVLGGARKSFAAPTIAVPFVVVTLTLRFPSVPPVRSMGMFTTP